MLPRPILPPDLDYWADQNPRPMLISGPGELEANITPCPAVVTTGDLGGPLDGLPVVRVPWTLDEIELFHLAHGGTLWLSTWGSLPIHSLEVQPAPERQP